jgi:Flp pilus assembly pilin Flp
MRERQDKESMYRVLDLWKYVQAQREGVLEGRRRGQGFVEYAFILVFVAVALTGALALLGGGVLGMFSRITACLGIVPGATC